MITGYRTNHANVLRAFVGRSSVPIFAAADPADTHRKLAVGFHGDHSRR